MNTYCTILYGDGKLERFVTSSYGYAEHLESLFNHCVSCYFDWTIEKTYKLKQKGTLWKT